MAKLTIPDVIHLFRAYYDRTVTGGSLHLLLDVECDLNDYDVRWCIGRARERQDTEAEMLGLILLGMSRTQRRKIGRMCSG